MLLSVQIDNCNYVIDAENAIDISIPLDFSGAQPNAYDVERAISKPCEAGDLIGDVRRGGSCNFEQIKFIPHCNGTHTECVGHITRERISIRDCLKDVFIPATLITIEPVGAFETDETYAVKLSESDELITAESIEIALRKIQIPDSRFQISDSKGLIVRTAPNDAGKLTRTYLDVIPPFFSIEAMKFIAEKQIEHLLVDTPSIDRIFDEGKLANHRAFWNVESGSSELNAASFPHRTITEMIFAPDEIADGAYLLNLQIAPFAADAAPSRPILFKLK